MINNIEYPTQKCDMNNLMAFTIHTLGRRQGSTCKCPCLMRQKKEAVVQLMHI